MQRPAAAVAEQDEIARVEAVLDGDFPNRAGHDHGGDRNDPVRHLYHTVLARIAERRGDFLGDRVLCRADIELHFAAQEILRIEPAEQQIRIGDRRLAAAAAVGNRAGRRARALRADVQAFLRIDPRDGAAAGADFDDVDNRGLDREAFDVAVGVVHRVDREASVLDQRALGRCPTHVEGNDVFEAELAGVGAGADAAADRS